MLGSRWSATTADPRTVIVETRIIDGHPAYVKVELFEHIRRDKREGGASIRGLARRHRVHRRTVRQALRSALPPPRKPASPSAPRLGAHRATIREWLVADLSAPRKQRHTARIWHTVR